MCIIILITATTRINAQNRTILADMNISNTEKWEVFNREGTNNVIEGNLCVYFKDAEGSGGAWIKDLEFENGVIEFDVRGRDVRGTSFVGIAFRGIDNETYDAIYFRPFNFKSDNELNLSHGVQYIDHPVNTWSKLRAEHTGIYEHEVSPVPDPEKFFHARIIIKDKNIKVYVNKSDKPCLEVKTLNDRKKGKLGLWMGHGSDGAFANLKITHF